MLTGKQRAALRKEAGQLTPAFQIGKDGVNPPLIEAAAECLEARELVKFKVLETSPQTAKETAALLSEETGSHVVQVIGHTLTLFLPKDEKSKFQWVFQ